MRLARAVSAVVASLLVAAAAASVVPVSTAQAVEPGADPFFTYSGSTPLASYANGDVLATRTVPFSIAGLPLVPLSTTQVLYRTTDQLGRPIANVTSVVRPLVPVPQTAGKLVSYQSFYDSLNPADGPSRGIAGALPSVGGSIVTAESALVTPLLAAGFTVNIPDTEGPDADFAAGPEYGRLTLDSIRAATRAAGTGLAPDAPVGMLGYSGGAIATGWAAALAPSYAPDVNARLVGATEGGVLVAPARNLRYIDGTPVWSGVAAMALVGVARAFDIDFSTYLSERGRQVFAQLETASIGQVLGQYPGLTFASLVKPEYADPTSIKPFVDAANALNLGSAPAPTIPMQIRQGAGGFAEGSPGDKPGIGPGDGVMIAGDVRALARQYCAAGTRVDHAQYDALSHVAAAGPWLPEAVTFLTQRFLGQPSADTCSSIAAGNSLAPEVYRASATPGTTTPGTITGAGTGRSTTRTRVRLQRVWQVRGRERTRLAVSVVTAQRPSAGARAGRAVVRVDGRKVRTLRVPVTAQAGRQVVGPTVRLPRSLSLGRHTVRVVFRPDDAAAYTRSVSRPARLAVVRSRPGR